MKPAITHSIRYSVIQNMKISVASQTKHMHRSVNTKQKQLQFHPAILFKKACQSQERSYISIIICGVHPGPESYFKPAVPDILYMLHFIIIIMMETCWG
jgi:hypothetical protein